MGPEWVTQENSDRVLTVATVSAPVLLLGWTSAVKVLEVGSGPDESALRRLAGRASVPVVTVSTI